jgi:hypothetical protein
MESFKIVLQPLPLKRKAFKFFSTLASQTETFDIGLIKQVASRMESSKLLYTSCLSTKASRLLCTCCLSNGKPLNCLYLMLLKRSPLKLLYTLCLSNEIFEFFFASLASQTESYENYVHFLPLEWKAIQLRYTSCLSNVELRNCFTSDSFEIALQ